MDRISSTRVAAAAVTLVALLLLPAWSVAGDDGWEDAHATFYGDESGAETMQGACGYGDLFQQGYGLETTALSVALFNEGWSCGGCHDETWCNPPLRHFDLSKPMFLHLVTDFRVGIIPVQYRRVPCAKRGGVRFEMKGNQWWVAVLVFNVAGPGEVKAMAVKGSKDGQWMDMNRNWGQIWTAHSRHVGQGLSRSTSSPWTTSCRRSFGQSFEASGCSNCQSFEARGQFWI